MEGHMTANPDVYTNPMIMGWMMDEYSKHRGQRTQRLGEIMRRETELVLDLAEESGAGLRMAAYSHALQRIGAAVESQGTYAYFAGEAGD